MEQKHCKWYNDEFCTNGDSPCVADYCPVVEYPELCKCRELDNEKELTDEEIIKALEEMESDCPANFSASVLDLIHRLQTRNELLEADHSSLLREADGYTQTIAEQNAEIERLTEEIDQRRKMMNRMDCNYATELQKNAELKKKIENQKSVIKWQADRIKKEKAENQRLYDEFVRLDDFCATKGCICCVCENKKTCKECSKCESLKTEKCNNFKIDVSKYTRAIERADKLQKQVDELKARDMSEMRDLFNVETDRLIEKAHLQAVKDTANKVYKGLCENGNWNEMKEAIKWGDESEELKALISKIVGVEVE